MSDYRDLKLPEELCAAAERKFGKTFDNIEVFLDYVLRDLLKDEAEEMDQAEQKIIEERLRELGYF